MGTVHDFPGTPRHDEWPAEFIQADCDDDEAEAVATIGLARQLGQAVLACAIGLIVVILAALAINAAFALNRPFVVAAPTTAGETPVNP